ncbi:MAG: pilin [Candidatus Pacebacteria bacterium]|jgi:hypothetical protein|nr:pilin [Candidatus Paceibacterota bacterium]
MKKFIATAITFLTPMAALAQVNFQSSPTALNIIGRIQTIINYLIPLFITAGVALFIWGVVVYVIAKNEEAKKEGRDKMIYGIIGLFVILSIWGLVGLLGNTFGINQQGGQLTPNQLPSIYVQ